MSDHYREGDKVEWNWGGGTGTGVVRKKYTHRQTLKIKGAEVTRNADDDNPAYRIEQSDGDTVLKSHSELRSTS